MSKLFLSLTSTVKLNTPHKQKFLEQKIDQMVYKLYGLTSEEIKIVEESIK